MRYSKLILALIGSLGVHMAGAVPTPEEIAQLGKTLTPWGAIKAGNKEGTIPEWTGGLCTPPANYKPRLGLEVGGGPFVDPYAADKPLFKITAENLAQYADKVDEGNKELFRRFPKTYYMNIYQSRRSYCAANYIYENTIKHATRAKIVGDGSYSITGAQAQVPFPFPKTGIEVMWNKMFPADRPYTNSEFKVYYVDPSGNKTITTSSNTMVWYPYMDNSLASLPEDQPYRMGRSLANYPPAKANSGNLLYYYTRQDLKGFPVWSYLPGQRRVRLAPEFAYDGVNADGGGTMLYDEGAGFMGRMDRFDFNLVGKVEMYIPYNNSEERMNNHEEVVGPAHPDPAAVRWELHRVYKIDAPLKKGFRHVQKKKIFYIDEDSYILMSYIGIDQADKIHHVQYLYLTQLYDRPATGYTGNVCYDFAKGAYTYWMFSGTASGLVLNGQVKHKPRPASFWTPDNMAGSNVR